MSTFHLDCIRLSEGDLPKGDFYCSEECVRVSGADGTGTVAHKIIDRKNEYTKKLLWSGLNHMVISDVVKENDGPGIKR